MPCHLSTSLNHFAIHPRTWILPPPCFTVGAIQSGWYLSPFLLHTNILQPGISSNVDSFENRTCLHCSRVQSFLSWHQASLLLLCDTVRRAFLPATHLLNPALNSLCQTVLVALSTPVASCISLLSVLDGAL